MSPTIVRRARRRCLIREPVDRREHADRRGVGRDCRSGSSADTAKVYFEGAGYAFTHIVSVIVAANCFGAGIKQLHLDEPIRQMIGERPELVWLLSAALRWHSLPCAALGWRRPRVSSKSSRFQDWEQKPCSGRRRDFEWRPPPAARCRPSRPSSLTCSKLTDSNSLAIARRVARPLIAATGATILFAWWRG